MKIRSGTNVWYLLVLIALAIIFIFAGIKYLGKGDTSQQKTVSGAESTKSDDLKSASDSASLDLPQDQQYATKGADSMDKGDYLTAIDYFAKAIAVNPSVISYYSLKAQAEVLAGKAADAKSTLEAGLKVDSENELLNSKLDVLNNSNNLAPAGQDTPRQ
ncbi:MAG: hypothetical protein NTY30_04615 [Candidatus Berkelbacteria bacterium]|nr:hypothetical protein [Candidatus Berkelbacteria bacterium]